MAGRYVLGIDTSTTATKAILVDADGTVVATASSEYAAETPQPLWSEQDPRLWWTGTCAAIRGALAAAGAGGDDVAAVGMDGQMHGMTLLDASGAVLRPAILWNDQRTAAECDEIRAAVGRERLIALTGNEALPGLTAPKILWVRRHEPDVWARIARVLLPKDAVRWWMSGDAAADVSDASGMGLLDHRARTWSGEVLDRLGIPAAWLPRLVEGPDVTGVVSAAAAAETGLRAGTPIVGGAGDQAANAVGLGIVDPGPLALSLGTSGVVFAAADAPVHDPDGWFHAFCHAVPGRWHLMGVMQSAAGSLRWLRDAIAPGVPFDTLVAEAAAVPPGADGLLFAPYLSGERHPHPDPTIRGAFVGLTLGHGRGHLVRAVLEGVAFGLRDNLDRIRAIGAPVTSARMSGGGTRSDTWRGILVDVLGVPLAGVATAEGAAFGAAVLAATGAGWFPDVAAAARAMVHPLPPVEPGPGAARYAELHGLFRQLYPALRGISADLGKEHA